MLETATSSTMFHYGNSFSFLKQCTLQISIFKVGGSPHFKQACSPKLKKHMYLSKESIRVTSTCFPVRTVLGFERNSSWCLQEEIGCVQFLKTIQMSRGSPCTSKRKVCMVEALASSTIFPLRVELHFQKSNSCNSQFSRLKRLIFFQIALLG